MRNVWKKYLALLDADLSATVFDNIKNLLVCALLFAAGTDALQGDHQLFMGFVGSPLCYKSSCFCFISFWLYA